MCYSITIEAAVVSETLLTNMKTSAQDNLDYDNHDFLMEICVPVAKMPHNK